MTKSEFFKSLSSHLRNLPEEKQREALGYYEGVLDGRMESGLSEEEALAAFGSAERAALEFINRNFTPSKHRISGKIKSMPTFFRVVFSSILVALCYLLIVALWFAAFSLFAFCAFLGLGGICAVVFGIIFCFIRTLPLGLCVIGGGIVSVALSLLLLSVAQRVYKIFRLICALILSKARRLLAREALAV